MQDYECNLSQKLHSTLGASENLQHVNNSVICYSPAFFLAWQEVDWHHSFYDKGRRHCRGSGHEHHASREGLKLLHNSYTPYFHLEKDNAEINVCNFIVKRKTHRRQMFLMWFEGKTLEIATLKKERILAVIHAESLDLTSFVKPRRCWLKANLFGLKIPIRTSQRNLMNQV